MPLCRKVHNQRLHWLQQGGRGKRIGYVHSLLLTQSTRQHAFLLSAPPHDRPPSLHSVPLSQTLLIGAPLCRTLRKTC